MPVGLIAAARRYSLFDYTSMVGMTLGIALPNFWVGIMLIIIFGLMLGWLPSGGLTSWTGYILPVAVLVTDQTALLARLMRGSTLEVLGQDYVTTARAKGLTRHVVRNALLPVITVLGCRLAFILNGTIVVEYVFALPGLGRLFIDSVHRLDYQVVRAIVVLLIVVVIAGNLLTELAYVDSILSRFVDALMAFPILALLIVLAAAIGPSPPTVVVVIGATVWAAYARVARADVMSPRERYYVVAAGAAGATSARIIVRHMLPNVFGPVIVLASLGIGGIIILESALSFLGLGIQEPRASWGRTLADGRAYVRTYPHIAIVPGVLVTLTVLVFNLVGDGRATRSPPSARVTVATFWVTRSRTLLCYTSV